MKRHSIVGLCMLLFICTTARAQMTITSFTPTSGPIGTTVNINGTNFNSIPADNIVFFGATKAAVTSASTTSLTVTVPAGATYQPISVTDFFTNLTVFSSEPFLITFSCGTGISSTSFSAKTDFTTGISPWGTFISDLDGDGKSDIIAANNSTSSISVLKNTSAIGAISFAAKIEFATESQPRSVFAGDLDGDGRPDIVTANICYNSISILQNTSTVGNISFAPQIVLVMSGPLSASIADLDGDGKPDIAVANWGESTISVLRNISIGGSLSFAAPIDYPTGPSPTSIILTDLDGDNKLEMAVVNEDSDSVSVLKNTSTIGSISFSPKVDFPVGSYPAGLCAGDLDNDGKSDLAISNWDADTASGIYTISVLKNISTTGSIAFAGKTDFNAGTTPALIAMNDMDGDGKIDLSVPNWGSNTVSVFGNISSSTIQFAARVNYTTGSYPQSISLGDIDGDGQPDIVVSNVMSNTISVFRNLECITGFSELADPAFDFNVYPNPFSYNTTLSFANEIEHGKVRVINILGKEVKLVIFSGRETVVEKGELEAGIYFIEVLSNKTVVGNKKIIIQ